MKVDGQGLAALQAHAAGQAGGQRGLAHPALGRDQCDDTGLALRCAQLRLQSLSFGLTGKRHFSEQIPQRGGNVGSAHQRCLILRFRQRHDHWRNRRQSSKYRGRDVMRHRGFNLGWRCIGVFELTVELVITVRSGAEPAEQIRYVDRRNSC